MQKLISKVTCAVLVSLSICCAVLDANGQDSFPYEKYKERTLAEMVQTGIDLPKKVQTGKPLPAPDLIMDADFMYSRVRVRYLERSRPVSVESRELLKMWQKSFSIEQKIMDLYENEYLFKECDVEYWIPVQKQVAAYFPKELKSGDMVTLFLLRAIGKKLNTGDRYSFLFLLTEFDK